LNDKETQVADLQGSLVVQMRETFGGGFRGAPGERPKEHSIAWHPDIAEAQQDADAARYGPVGKFGEGKVALDKCRSFQIGRCDADGHPPLTTGHSPPLFVTVDG